MYMNSQTYLNWNLRVHLLYNSKHKNQSFWPEMVAKIKKNCSLNENTYFMLGVRMYMQLTFIRKVKVT